jgi:hypothetical protein
MKKVAEGISHHQWYNYYECEQCGSIQTSKLNRPPRIQTEYSWSSTPSTPIGIEWP